MSTQITNFFRGLAGFVVGGMVAATSAGFTLVLVCPMPKDEPGVPNYGPAALSLVVFVAFIIGGFVGLRGSVSRCPASLWRPVAVAYAVMVFLGIISDASLFEASAIIGFVSVGVAASIALVLAVMRWFPPRELNDAA